MAGANQIAEFFATLGLKVREGDIKKFDKTLSAIETRAKKFSETALSDVKVTITGYRFSEGFNTKLYKALQKKMTIVNNKKGISPEITVSKFQVDREALLREMKSAANYVEQNLRIRIRPNVTPRTSQEPSGGLPVARGGIHRFGAGLGVGAAAGSLGRGFIPGLGLAFGVSQLNQLNQQLIGQNLAATAVFGSKDAGQRQLEWLRNVGNTIGFDYRSQANPYMKMAAAGTTAGMEVQQVQKIFQSMAEYGRVMGLNDEDMKGSMRAIEQMLNKGQVYAEELKMQLGEKFPAAIQLMAEAVSGGDTQKLFKMMEQGQVSSIEALPKFAEILAVQARRGGALADAMKTSLAEQMRFNNTFNDLVMFMSEAGFEKGQAGIFRTMADFFEEMKPLLQAFGEGWKYISSVIRIPLGLFADAGKLLEAMSKATNTSKGALMGLGVVIGGLLLPFTRTLTIVTMLLGALEDFTAFLSGRDSLIGRLAGKDGEKLRENFIQVFEEAGSLLKTVYNLLGQIIGILTGNNKSTFIDSLNQSLKTLQSILESINVFLGGKSNKQRELEAQIASETNPNIRNALIAQRDQLYSNEQKTPIQSLKDNSLNALKDKFSSLDTYLPVGSPGRQAYDELAAIVSNFTNYSDNLSQDESNRVERMRMLRPDLANPQGSASVQNNYSFSIDASGHSKPEDVEQAVRRGVSDIADRLHDKSKVSQ